MQLNYNDISLPLSGWVCRGTKVEVRLGEDLTERVTVTLTYEPAPPPKPVAD